MAITKFPLVVIEGREKKPEFEVYVDRRIVRQIAIKYLVEITTGRRAYEKDFVSTLTDFIDCSKRFF